MTQQATVAPARRPFSIEIAEPAGVAFDVAAALIRLGYCFSPDLPVTITPQGHALFTLILSQPDQAAVDRAMGFVDLGNQLEEARFQREVEARARQLLEDHKAQQAAAALAALKAQQQKELRALERANAAALAAL